MFICQFWHQAELNRRENNRPHSGAFQRVCTHPLYIAPFYTEDVFNLYNFTVKYCPKIVFF